MAPKVPVDIRLQVRTRCMLWEAHAPIRELEHLLLVLEIVAREKADAPSNAARFGPRRCRLYIYDNRTSDPERRIIAPEAAKCQYLVIDD